METRVLSVLASPSSPSRRSCPSSLEDPRVRHRPPANLYLADDVLLRHHPPVTAVGAVVAVVAHHEVVAFRYHLRTPVVVAAVVRLDVVVLQRDVVDVHAAVDDANGVAFLRDDALHE